MCIACDPGSLAVARAGTGVLPTLERPDPLPRRPRPAGPTHRQRRRGDRADVVLTGGRVLTMAAPSGATPGRAEAVAVRDGRIMAVGSSDDVGGLVGPDTQVVGLDGRTLLPGLIDPHMHFVFVLFEDWVDVSPMAAPHKADVDAALRAAVATAGPGEWVRARQYDPSLTVDGPAPTRAELDALAPDTPVFVLESNAHVAYANSTALRLAGITRDTPDPPTARFARDADGELTGRLEEPPAFMPFMAVMPTAGGDEVRARTRRLLDHAASVGCTTLHDCGIGMLTGPGDLALLRAVMAEDPPVRYRGMLVSTAMDAWEEMGVRPGDGDDRFRVEGVKAWSDGSNQARTGFQREDYLGGGRGALNYSAEELAEAVARAHRGGWQVGVHANGDAAIDVTLDAFAAALDAAPRPDHRHRVEHCSVLHADQMDRMATLGVSPSFLIGHVRWWGRAFRDRVLGPDRAALYDPCATALAHGLRISLHSDWNVTPLEPLRYVADAAARVMDEGGEVLGPDERIPVEAALRAVTADAAWQCRVDHLAGSLEPGKAADLAVLEEDPTAVDPARIGDIAVSETWLDGVPRHGH
ncbi:amidohydrolase family protein [Iamia majanohamensis]|uniref:Amidohydrolase family protein n=1 Tax=Iamia majanohamensis TaxID=467976 RepID=A0AAE9Y9B2_9ACTN|nr:amidohydrolase family protein [Iamia majanohamensis]WCO68146.1 amidohydrolase family protein [Iamia majanohamensis]